jgi:hypothetical protein
MISDSALWPFTLLFCFCLLHICRSNKCLSCLTNLCDRSVISSNEIWLCLSLCGRTLRDTVCTGKWIREFLGTRK